MIRLVYGLLELAMHGSFFSEWRFIKLVEAYDLGSKT